MTPRCRNDLVMNHDGAIFIEWNELQVSADRNRRKSDYDLRGRARNILKLRRERDRLLDRRLFGEPGWDILLELYVAHCDRKPVTVSAIAQASGAPATTGLRYITLLADAGLLERTKASQDRRTIHVALTMKGLAAIEVLLARYPA